MFAQIFQKHACSTKFKLDSVLPNEGNERDAAILNEKTTFGVRDTSDTEVMNLEIF